MPSFDDILDVLAKDVPVPEPPPAPPRHPPPQLQFPSEAHAREALETLLEPWFTLVPEVWLTLGHNKLRIDYLAQPHPGLEFPYPWFGIECKAGLGLDMGEYNRALKQAIDYAGATVSDSRLPALWGKLVGQVFVFPGLHERGENGWLWPGSVNRLAGMFHVGMIYNNPWHGLAFYMSAVRQWSHAMGSISEKMQRHIHRVGSGRPKRQEPKSPINLAELGL